jgi:hypothetical protein
MRLRTSLAAVAMLLLAGACAPAEQRAYNDSGGVYGKPRDQVGTAWETMEDGRLKAASASPRASASASQNPERELPRLWPAAMRVAAQASIEKGSDAFVIETARVFRSNMRQGTYAFDHSVVLSLVIVPSRLPQFETMRGQRYNAREIQSGKIPPLPTAMQSDPGRRIVQDLMR